MVVGSSVRAVARVHRCSPCVVRLEANVLHARLCARTCACGLASAHAESGPWPIWRSGPVLGPCPRGRQYGPDGRIGGRAIDLAERQCSVCGENRVGGRRRTFVPAFLRQISALMPPSSDPQSADVFNSKSLCPSLINSAATAIRLPDHASFPPVASLPSSTNTSLRTSRRRPHHPTSEKRRDK